MDVATLEGFIVAIAIGPGVVLPSAWLPWVWDMEEGKVAAPFESETQANRIMSLVLRYYNAVLDTFSTVPSSFAPVFWRSRQWGAVEWCEGFILGCQFHEDAWRLRALAQPAMFDPFLRLGTDIGIAVTRRENDADTWANKVGGSVIEIQAYWKNRRQHPAANQISNAPRTGSGMHVAQVVRNGPKIGRNDPCPCGSGKKFKVCCGAGGASSLLH